MTALEGTNQITKKTKMMYVELEVIKDVAISQNLGDISFWPHEGFFLLIRTDGMMSVVSVQITEGNTFATVTEVWIGCMPTIESEFVMDSHDVDEKMSAMIKRYDEDVARRKHDIEQEYELKRKDLEHEYEMKKKELETEMPKRMEQGEWVSGKTLTEIIRILVPGNDAK